MASLSVTLVYYWILTADVFTCKQHYNLVAGQGVSISDYCIHCSLNL